MRCDAALRIMARKIFSPSWQSVGSRLFLGLVQIWGYVSVPVFPFQVDAGCCSTFSPCSFQSGSLASRLLSFRTASICLLHKSDGIIVVG